MNRKKALLARVLLVSLSSAIGCGGTEGLSGLEEPLLAHGAQFVRGELPGDPPLTPGSGEIPKSPRVTGATASVAYLRERLRGVSFSGQASDDAMAVGLRIEDRGEGYWLVPTLFPDVQSPGELLWRFNVDLQDSLPAGQHRLLTVAFDEDGNPGTQASTTICVNSLVPDNGNACNPARVPPFLVISLEWDTPVDLDLRVVLPDGQVIDAEHPVSGEPDSSGKIDLNARGVGKLQTDSNHDCVIDGRQREDIVFRARPRRGRYTVYASLNRACEQAGVTYKSSYHVRTQDGEDYGVDSRDLGAGSLVPEQAGLGPGTFVGEVTIN